MSGRTAAAILLFGIAVAVRLAVIALSRFDGLYGQDAYAYFDYARQVFDVFWGVPLTGPFYWPLGYPALAAAFFLVTGPTPLGAQIASAAAGAAIVPLVYGIAVEVSRGSLAGHRPGPRILLSDFHPGALAAGLIVATSGQLLVSSVVIMADAAALLWATLSAYCLLRWHSAPGPAPAEKAPLPGELAPALWLPIAGLALAFAVSSRWLYATLIPPFGVFAWIAARRWAESAGPSMRLAMTVAAALAICILIAVVLPQVAFSQASAAPLFGHSWVVGWNPANALRTSFDNADGHFDYRFPPLLYYAGPLIHPAYLVPLLTPFVLAGAWRLRRDPALLLLGGWMAAPYLFLAGIPYENMRFGLTYFPPVAILAGVGLQGAGLRGRWAGRMAGVLLAAALALSCPAAQRSLTSILAVKSRELGAMRYLQRRFAPGTAVVTFGLTLTLRHYAAIDAIDLSDHSPPTLYTLTCSAPGRPMVLFVEVDNIRSQWSGKAPALNLAWLEGAGALREIGRQGTWTLFEVGRKHCAARTMGPATIGADQVPREPGGGR